MRKFWKFNRPVNFAVGSATEVGEAGGYGRKETPFSRRSTHDVFHQNRTLTKTPFLSVVNPFLSNKAHKHNTTIESLQIPDFAKQIKPQRSFFLQQQSKACIQMMDGRRTRRQDLT
jgi:hypothetical protein